MSITEAEIIEQIRSSMVDMNYELCTEAAMTSTEISEALGLSDKAIRKHLKTLIQSGKMKVVKTVRVNMVGVPSTVPAYKLQE